MISQLASTFYTSDWNPHYTILSGYIFLCYIQRLYQFSFKYFVRISSYLLLIFALNICSLYEWLHSVAYNCISHTPNLSNMLLKTKDSHRSYSALLYSTSVYALCKIIDTIHICGFVLLHTIQFNVLGECEYSHDSPFWTFSSLYDLPYH